MIILSAVLCFLLGHLPEKQLYGLESVRTGLFVLLILAFLISNYAVKIRLFDRKFSVSRIAIRAILRCGLTFGLYIVLLALCYKASPRRFIFDGFLISSITLMLWHICINRLAWKLRFHGFQKCSALFIGSSETASNLYNVLTGSRKFVGYQIEGFFSSENQSDIPDGAILLGKVEDAFPWLESNHPDEIYCSLPPTSHKEVIDRLVKHCNQKFIDFYFVPTMEGYPDRTMTIDRIGNVNIVKLREEPMDGMVGKIYRRAFSLLVSTLFLCTLYPFIFVFAAIGIKLSSPGPIYFKQKRTGYSGKSFYIYKFRSMKSNSEADTLQATEDDPRKTKFGDFLRRTSIDEFPQFINVFKGDMNIVGPRPHMEHHTEVYSKLIEDYMLRHLAKPGITGWAQITGFRGETKTTEQMAERIKRDIWYIENWTPLLDIEIIFKTIWQMLKGDGEAY